MASLLRVILAQGRRTCLSSIVKSNSVSLKRNIPSIQPACIRFIATSKKNKDAVTVADKTHLPSKTEDVAERDENWISFGYDLIDRDIDEWHHHMIMFLTITVIIVGGTFYFSYLPDYRDIAWSQREAYMELARRERDGLPLIDANVVDPSRIELPSEDELGDFDIVI